MRVVLQRVHGASVSVGDKLVGKIDRGLMLLVGIEVGDTSEELDYCVRKVLNLRVWPSSLEDIDGSCSPRGRDEWRQSVQDINGGILCVSQFTLLGSIKKGNKPTYHHAMPPVEARAMFDGFVEKVRKLYPQGHVATGAFGEYMRIRMDGDGPVTLVIESKPKGSSDK